MPQFAMYYLQGGNGVEGERDKGVVANLLLGECVFDQTLIQNMMTGSTG